MVEKSRIIGGLGTLGGGRRKSVMDASIMAAGPLALNWTVLGPDEVNWNGICYHIICSPP